MATGRVPTTANSPLTAKGDLFTYSTAPARLAVGNSGEQIVADSATSTGLRYQGSYPAGKNMLINGLLDIWQRATTITGQANGYITADRWYFVSSASCTFAQETTTIPAGCRYSQKVTVGASAATTAGYQSVETSNAVAYAGQSVTLSGRFQSSVTPTVTLDIAYSTSVDNPVASSWTSITATSGGSGTAGASSFTTISGVYAIPSTAKSLRIGFSTSSMASTSILYYGGFQAELGSVVTSLVRNAATIQGELAACQRYYQRFVANSGYQRFATSIARSTTTLTNMLFFPVIMRIPPTTVDYSTLIGFDGTNFTGTVSALAVTTTSTSIIEFETTVTGATQYRPYQLIANNSTNAYLAFNAEL